MWLLSDDGAILGGKRVWLRPGSSFVLGRTSSKPKDGQHARYIDNGSVSRQHLQLRVSDLERGDSGCMCVETTVVATDKSKKKTFINGEELHQGSRTLDAGQEYVIKLGVYENQFKLEWKPVVLSFTSLPKSAKAKGTALATETEKLGQADVKLAAGYITNTTTHVVAKKRNTAAGLQALVQGRWVVTDSWVNGLAEACKPRGGGEDGSPPVSLLEEDFDGNWPREADYVVPTAGEPVCRPNDWLKPDLRRAEVFSEFTFVFLAQSQYDTLHPVVSGGGGKAVVYPGFQPGQTTVQEVVHWVKQHSGNKDYRRFQLSQEPTPGGIVIVRPADKDVSRSNDFLADLDIALDQASMEQQWFLDAILSNDASTLRRPLRDATQSSAVAQPSQAQAASPSRSRPPVRERPVTVPESPAATSQQPPTSAQDPPRTQPQPEEQPAEEPATTGRRNRRIITQPTFRGFDDFDPSQVIRADSSSPEPPFRETTPGQAPSVQSMDIDKPSNTQRSTRKRPAAAIEEQQPMDTEEKLYERILTGGAELKRRKTEALKKGDKSFSRPPEPEVSANVRKTEKADEPKNGYGRARWTKKEDPQAEMKAKIRARKEAEEEARQKDEETLRDAYNIDLAYLPKDPSEVETFELPVRPPREPRTNADRRNRAGWKEEWNRKQDFKKFRPKGVRDERREGGIESPRIIISLREVPGKGRGLGDDYWLEHGSSKNKKSESQSQSRNSQQFPSFRQSGAAAGGGDSRDDEDEDDEHAFRRRVKKSLDEDADARETAAVMDNEPNGTPSQTMRAGSQRKDVGAGKRPAQQPLAPPPAKRPRQASSRLGLSMQKMDDDSDDDDPMAFRRKRR